MKKLLSLVFFVSFVSVSLFPRPATAQIFEAVGTRAQGMGGAFVAVADDASATWWNPAGLASGAYFSSIIERASTDDPGTPAAGGPARRDTSSGVAITVPSLGLSYYHLTVAEVRPGSIAGSASDRQDSEAEGVDLRLLSVHRFAATIGQSIGSHLVIASTLGLLRGGVATSSEAASTDAIAHASALDVHTETHGDIDLGAMVSTRSLRLGMAVKHVTAPTFGGGDTEMTLDRQVRAGLAVPTHVSGAPLMLAADADLTKTPTANGDAQHVAAGAELWLGGKKIGIRGGVSANLVGEKRTVTSSGLSFAVKSGVYLDGAWTFGDDVTRSGWGITLRATF